MTRVLRDCNRSKGLPVAYKTIQEEDQHEHYQSYLTRLMKPQIGDHGTAALGRSLVTNIYRIVLYEL